MVSVEATKPLKGSDATRQGLSHFSVLAKAGNDARQVSGYTALNCRAFSVNK